MLTGLSLEERVDRIKLCCPDYHVYGTTGFEWTQLIMAVLKDESYKPAVNSRFYRENIINNPGVYSLVNPWLSLSDTTKKRIVKRHREIEEKRGF